MSDALTKTRGAALTADEERRWESLLGDAMLSLDEQEEAQHAKRLEAAAKKLRRLGLSEPPVDRARVVRFLLAYRGTGRYRESLSSAGLTFSAATLAYDLWPESKAAMEYARRLKQREREEVENDEIVDAARDGLRRLVSEDDCRLSQKAVSFALERLSRRDFGEEGADGKAGSRARATVNYNLPGLTLNLITAPAAALSRIGRGPSALPSDADAAEDAVVVGEGG